MALKNINPTSTTAWQNLQKHFKEMNSASMVAMFEKDK